MKKVSVIGAGFAGLSTSLKLAQKGFQVDLYESSGRVGGLIGTERTEYGLVEQAANSFIRTDKTEALFIELGLTPSSPQASSTKRFLYREQPRQWPLRFFESLCFIGRMSFRLLTGGKKSLAPRRLETLQAWGERNLGEPATRYILGPAMQGIYGNAAHGLSATLILQNLFKPKPKTGAKSERRYKGLLSGPTGMQDVIDRMESRLRELGVRIHLNSTVKISEIEGPVVVATSAKAAAEIVKDRDTELAALLAQVPMSSLMSSTLFFKEPQTLYKGFGCLIPRGAGFKTLGILMNPYIFEGRDKTYNETWIIGGVDQADLLRLSDEEVLKLIAEERFRILKQKSGLLDYRIHRWSKALPYYSLELEKVLQKIFAHANHHKVFLNGNYLNGIGLSKILERSEQLAEEIENHGW